MNSFSRFKSLNSSIGKAELAVRFSVLLNICTISTLFIGADKVPWYDYAFEFTLFFSIGIVLRYLSRISHTARDYANALQQAAMGDFETRIVHIDEGGDMGHLANNINHLLDLTDAFIREACNSMEAVNAGHYYRKLLARGMPGIYCRSTKAINAVTRATEKRIKAFKDYADGFESKVEAIITQVSVDADEARRASEKMAKITGVTNVKSQAASHASGATADNIQLIAAAAEQLSASIADITQRVDEAAGIARTATAEATQADAIMGRLDSAADNISAVIGLISRIAEQTNLLALNATIEAARAGEAGKGFAVVAGEVKTLASQTGRATDDITREIEQIQAMTRESVSFIRGISGTIVRIGDITQALANGTAEQRQATQEINRSLHEALQRTNETVGNVNDVERAATESQLASDRVLDIARELTRNAEELQTQVGGFLATARNV